MFAQTTEVATQLLPTWADVLAIALGAVSGSIVARLWGADIAGIALIAIVSGLGGGILRDLLLNRRPVALTNEVMIPVALVAAVVGFLFADVMARLHQRLDVILLVVDSWFVGTYAVIGAEKATIVGLPPASAVFVGVLAGVGGGLMRDVLLNEMPEVLQPGTLNAIAALVGCAIYVALDRAPGVDLVLLGFWCVAVIVVLRVASVWFDWRTPVPRDLLTESRAGRAIVMRAGLARFLRPIEPSPDTALTTQHDPTEHDPTDPG